MIVENSIKEIAGSVSTNNFSLKILDFTYLKTELYIGKLLPISN